jgi:hypothetical protein
MGYGKDGRGQRFMVGEIFIAHFQISPGNLLASCSMVTEISRE